MLHIANKNKSVNICGIKHNIIEKEDSFDTDLHFGQIDYSKALITVNKELTDDIKQETICHEIVHSILVHLGYNDLSNDEQFVQCLGNAINGSFNIKYND